MKETLESHEDFRERLARYFLIAYLANYHDVTFKTAEGYTKRGGGAVGSLWLALADISIEWVNKGINSRFTEAVESELGEIILLGEVD
jgi:hypothetical protein